MQVHMRNLQYGDGTNIVKTIPNLGKGKESHTAIEKFKKVP